MSVRSKICMTLAAIAFALIFTAESAFARPVPQGEPGIGTGVIFKPAKVFTEMQPVEVERTEVQPDAETGGMITQIGPQQVEIKTCDPMAYLTHAEWPGIKILQPYDHIPYPGAYEKEIWDGEFNPEESVKLSIEDPNQFDGDPRYATLKLERFVPGLTLQTQQEQRAELYGIEKKRGAQLVINCLLRITVKKVSPALSPGMNLTTGFAPQPCDNANCYLDLDVAYDTTGDRALYHVYTETSEYQDKDYIDLVRGGNAVWPYRMIMDSIWVKGCPYEAICHGADTHTYCGGEFAGNANEGDEDFIAKITLENLANQESRELKFYQSHLSGTPEIYGGQVLFDTVYLAQSQAVGKLQGITRNNKFGFFYFVTARGSYVRFYPQKPHSITLRGFAWYANATDYNWGMGGQPPGFFKNSYVFFRGVRIPISIHGWNQNYDGSDASKRVHGMHYNFWLANKHNIRKQHIKNGIKYVKSKWQMKAEIIPGPYTFPY